MLWFGLRIPHKDFLKASLQGSCQGSSSGSAWGAQNDFHKAGLSTARSQNQRKLGRQPKLQDRALDPKPLHPKAPKP